MRRMIIGLALAVLAIGPPSQVRANDAEDKAAAQEIADLLRDSGKIRNYNVGVKFKAGTVWLEGRVTSEAQMNEALMLVSDLDEVTQIVNNLTIGPAAKAQKAKSSKRVPIRRGNQETQLASAQRPMTRGVPLGMATGGGAAAPASYQQDPGGQQCQPGMMPGGQGGQGGGMGPGGPVAWQVAGRVAKVVGRCQHTCPARTDRLRRPLTINRICRTTRGRATRRIRTMRR